MPIDIPHRPTQPAWHLKWHRAAPENHDQDRSSCLDLHTPLSTAAAAAIRRGVSTVMLGSWCFLNEPVCVVLLVVAAASTLQLGTIIPCTPYEAFHDMPFTCCMTVTSLSFAAPGERSAQSHAITLGRSARLCSKSTWVSCFGHSFQHHITCCISAHS